MKPSQNICFFNTTLFWGGGEKWHFEAAQMMTNTNNNTFFVLDGKGELAKKITSPKITPFYIKVSNLSFLNPFKVNRLVRFYKQNNIDTVIFNSPKDLKLGGKAAKQAQVKNIVYRRGIAVEVKRNTLNQKLFGRIVTHFIFNSKATQYLLEKNFKECIETKKTAVIYNAIGLGDYQSSKRESQPLIIGNAGRLVEQKGQHYLIAIAKKLKEKKLGFKIKIAGEGPLHTSLQEQINREELSEQIELIGFVKDMKSFMNQIDIFVSTALWEGFGFVLAEAMVAKKPVVGFALSSNPELIQDGKNGFLVPFEDTDIFTQKIELLLNDSSLRETMGEAGHLFVKENFESEKQFQKLLRFIED